MGVGGRYYSSQSGDTYNTFDLPSYGIVDTALYYERDDFRVQVNFNNVFDKRHFVGAMTPCTCSPASRSTSVPA
ncbi:TonB-dependent receptor [Verrucomicrobium spinosum]|uniref:TonB-dependent receptor n=1 Tax=Verrucomicrobium spinosum TaxID=2736 RepID=UPI0009467DF8